MKIEGTSVKLSSSSSGERACRVEWLGRECRGEGQVGVGREERSCVV